ncbi:hypothetical protein DXG03_003474 [Asterophora parasitica]|uniref:Uncharacterized protein n=1 Tax=Asterophora parasitica TaxID=117018 RepID=A0A9P7KEI2_9AGAR|nr:hypothetical protein DXG03_003474 [Asterophora parasitica]
MSFSTLLQRRAHTPLSLFRRHASTKITKPKAKGNRQLPDEKLRALISLYHQTDTFITPENLSQRIDEAFVSSYEVPLKKSLPSIRDLETALTNQRNAPKIAEWDQETLVDRTIDDLYNPVYQRWSGVKTGRELKVVEALYGVNAAELGSTLPGLEALREAVETETVPNPLTEEELQGFESFLKEEKNRFLEKEPMEVPKN